MALPAGASLERAQPRVPTKEPASVAKDPLRSAIARLDRLGKRLEGWRAPTEESVEFQIGECFRIRGEDPEFAEKEWTILAEDASTNATNIALSLDPILFAYKTAGESLRRLSSRFAGEPQKQAKLAAAIRSFKLAYRKYRDGFSRAIRSAHAVQDRDCDKAQGLLTEGLAYFRAAKSAHGSGMASLNELAGRR